MTMTDTLNRVNSQTNWDDCGLGGTHNESLLFSFWATWTRKDLSNLKLQLSIIYEITDAVKSVIFLSALVDEKD